MCIVKDGEKETSAYLSSESNMTSFRFGSQNIRFRTSSKLERYISVKEWDKGYIVVMAKYRDLGEIEDYIDLVPELRRDAVVGYGGGQLFLGHTENRGHGTHARSCLHRLRGHGRR